MFNVAHVYEYSLDIKESCPPSRSVQTADILHPRVSGYSGFVIGPLTLEIGEDLAINLWDLGSGKRIKKMTGHTASIYSLAFSAESSLLVSGGADWTVRCWDVKSAGGMPNKAREADGTNGTNGVSGTTEEEDGINLALREPGENIQTYVHAFIVVSSSHPALPLGLISSQLSRRNVRPL